MRRDGRGDACPRARPTAPLLTSFLLTLIRRAAPHRRGGWDTASHCESGRGSRGFGEQPEISARAAQATWAESALA